MAGGFCREATIRNIKTPEQITEVIDDRGNSWPRAAAAAAGGGAGWGSRSTIGEIVKFAGDERGGITYAEHGKVIK